MFDLKAYSEAAAKCSHCKFCQAVCPVYLEELVETLSARGRVNLVAACLIEESLPPGPRFREALDRCLLCSSCVRACPAAVPVDEIVIAARHEVDGGKNASLPRRMLLRRFMDSRGEDWAFAAAVGMGRRLGLAPPDLPRLAPEPSSRRRPPPPPAEARAAAVYFVGCATNVFYPETAADALRVLAINGIDARSPSGLGCCGLPALVEGDLETARALMRRNVELIADHGPADLVTDCTSCAAAFRHWGPKLFAPGDKIREQADLISLRVFEAGEYLAKLGLAERPGPLDREATYHVPCHRGPNPELMEAPRALLGAIPGLKLKEMEFPERCCGAGGSFHLTHRGLATAIRAKKIADIRATGAAILVTQCPSCRSFLAPALAGIEVMHPLSLLARAYGF